MEELIDFAVCIDIPLEVALTRRILVGIQKAKNTPDETLKNVEEYLSQYLMGFRSLYHVINMKVMPDCDLVVNGLEPVEILADKVIEEIKKRNIPYFQEDNNIS